MRQQLTGFDIYDIFNFPDNGAMCRFNRLKLTKEEFLEGEFFDDTQAKKWLLYFILPPNDEVTMDELYELLSKTTSSDVVWGCSSDNEIVHYEVFLIKTY